MTTSDGWVCTNVGVDSADIMAKEMSIVWLLVDFFSCYHLSEVNERHGKKKCVKNYDVLIVFINQSKTVCLV